MMMLRNISHQRGFWFWGRVNSDRTFKTPWHMKKCSVYKMETVCKCILWLFLY